VGTYTQPTHFVSLETGAIIAVVVFTYILKYSKTESMLRSYTIYSNLKI